MGLIRKCSSGSKFTLHTITTFFATVAALLYVTCGQELFAGWCPNVKPLNPFLVQNYSGLWYEIEKYWFIPEAQSTCIRVTYADNGDQTITVNVRQLVNRQTEWNNSGITRYVTSPADGANLILDLIVEQSPLPFVISYPYLILDTDYTNYTIKYACKQLGFYNLQTMWILSRSKVVTPELQRLIYARLDAMGLDSTRLTKTDLTTCRPDQ